MTLVAHGLNLKPEAMLPLVHWLNAQGSDVFLLRLCGHREGSRGIREVSAAAWAEEVQAACREAASAAQRLAVPCYFLGYSLGALLVQEALAFAGDAPPFDKQVLLAPATGIRRRSYLLKLLFLFGKNFSLPSYSPAGYRVHNRLPLSVYRILFAAEKNLKAIRFRGLDFPTLVLIDPKDELISYRKLEEHILTFGLTRYRLVRLRSRSQDRGGRFHHQIIDEASVGKENWNLMTAEMKAFLFG